MRLRDALAQSINIPAVKLFYLAGTKDSLNTAQNMGISTLTDPGRYGLTLVIGGGEVSLLDMTSAYSVLGNSGIRNPYTGILRIENLDGEIVEEWRPEPREVLPKNTALLLSDILSDNAARIPTFGANSPLNIPGHDVAVKTGTTNNNKDAWTIGYTPTIAVGVWAGNNDNVPMKKGGASLAGPIWNKYMKEALAVLPNETFEEPDKYVDPFTTKPALRGLWQGNEGFFVDKVSGKLATEDTPEETLVERVVTEVHTILYWVDKNDITGPPPANPAKDPQFNNWETAVQNWWAQHRQNYPQTSWNDRPVATDDVHTNTKKPQVTILSPKNDSVYSVDQRVVLNITTSGPYPITKIDLFLNNSFIESMTPPWVFSFTPEEIENLREWNELKLVYYDSVYNRGETTATFRVENN